MTPEEWVRLTPEQQAAHVAQYGPPPDDFAAPPPGVPPRPRRRAGLWIALGVIAALLVGGIVVALQDPAAPTPASSAPSSTAVPTTSSPPTVEDAFVADVLDTPGLTTDMARAEIVGLGRSMCEAIPEGKDHADLASQLGASKFGPQVMEVFLTAAEKHLCPYAIYGTDLPPAPAGPLTSVPPGTYEVGTVTGQVPPGKYRSAGPDNGGACYYARLRSTDDGDIIDNDLSRGPSILTVKASDKYLRVSGCTFTKG